jgi:hypothetical protein
LRLAAKLKRAAHAYERGHIGSGSLQSRYQFGYRFVFVRRAVTLLYALAQECGIEFETVKLVF